MCLLYLCRLWPLSPPLVLEEEFLIHIVLCLQRKWWKCLFASKIRAKDHHHHCLWMKMRNFWSLRKLKKVTRIFILWHFYVLIIWVINKKLFSSCCRTCSLAGHTRCTYSACSTFTLDDGWRLKNSSFYFLLVIMIVMYLIILILIWTL